MRPEKYVYQNSDYHHQNYLRNPYKTLCRKGNEIKQNNSYSIIFFISIIFFYMLSGNKLFQFPEIEVDFYLPQLISMYIHMQDVAEVIHPYLLQRLDY